MGFFSAANACSQLIFRPTIVHFTGHHGWRIASLLVAGFALAIVRLSFWPFVSQQPGGREDDRIRGHRGFDRRNHWAKARPTGGAMAETLGVHRHAMRFRAFWILAGVAQFTMAGMVTVWAAPEAVATGADKTGVLLQSHRTLDFRNDSVAVEAITTW